ncbi:MAG: class I SAM-dependent methyltransferase [Thermoguttaceae bacterium]
MMSHEVHRRDPNGQPCEEYQLLDFGRGRRLERFGEVVLDRPCPAAEAFERADERAWSQADARFEGRDQEKGLWTAGRELPERWIVGRDRLRFELKRTDFGHVGLFPEQAENWAWILGQCRSAAPGTAAQVDATTDVPSAAKQSIAAADRIPTILNLFAYTGGSTLAAAAAGAEVVHVDAAKNVVAWARRNAELSGLADAPLRWIAEDALKFVKRELRRGNGYDAVILDPPSYGHGPRGEVWRLSKHLPRLLSLCGELTAGRLRFMLVTCHTPGYDAAVLREMLEQTLGAAGRIEARPLTLRSAAGRELPSGVMARWQAV